MADVRVPLDDAVGRRLPLVSVRSGAPADGYLGVPLGLGPVARLAWIISGRGARAPQARLPLTQGEFDRIIRLRRAQRDGIALAGLFVALGAVFARFPVLFPLGVAIGLLSLALTVTARMAEARFTPDVEPVGGARLRLIDAHPGFVEAVRAGRRRGPTRG
ncbi:MAG: hypothetical protein ACE5GB_01825 [Acidimicrobiales bacterium]